MPISRGKLPGASVAGDQPHAGESLGKDGFLRSVANVAGQRHTHSHAHGVAVDGSDRGFLELVDAQRDAAGLPAEGDLLAADGVTGLHFAPRQGTGLSVALDGLTGLGCAG